MYNTIYPTNINYRKYGQYQNGIGRSLSAKPSNGQEGPIDAQITPDNKEKNTFPNGTKVAIDYSKGKINISQVIADFRSTILAINAPKEVEDEVKVYLDLVEKESRKETPSREIIISNLKNASKISDNFIASALGKQSNVVENWINTLFLQNINLKSDPNEVNPDFQLQFPQKAQDRINKAKEQEEQVDEAQYETVHQEPDKKVDKEETKPISFNEPVKIESSIELSKNDTSDIQDTFVKKTPYSPNTTNDLQARELLAKIKEYPSTNKGDADKINLLNEALGLLQNDSEANPNIKAAIHLERGKIFDNYDYVNYALRDYFEATKANEPNLKANAFYKSGNIYDEFNKFNPALDNYLSSVAYSGEANNSTSQTKVLTKISSLYAKRYDKDGTESYSNLAIDSANNTNNPALIAFTYSNAAQNYQYIGEKELALDSYKNAIKNYFETDESYEQMAYNYEQAAQVMKSLGNIAKADNLQKKALLYYQKAQLQDSRLE